MTAAPRTRARFAPVLLVPGALLALGAGPNTPPGAATQEVERFPDVETPVENPTTAVKALLGKALFWDEQLSASGTMACGTCHRFEAGGSDPRPGLDPAGSTHPGADGVFGTDDDVLGSPGVVRQRERGAYEPAELFGLAPQVTPRRAPSVINAAFAPKLLWDGRAEGSLFDPVDGRLLAAEGAALEIQAVEPPLSSVEMAHTSENWSAIAERVARATPLALASDLPGELAAFTDDRTYPELFRDAFGTDDVSPARILFALAAYQRTLVSDQSPWDDYLAGDLEALSGPQLTGRDLFFGQAKCSECHSGPRLTDDLFHDIGVRPDHEDLGRGAITGLAEDEGRFRTPGLRNVELRAPYFHNGGAASLGAVVSFYDDGGDFEADELIQPLELSPPQRLSLVAFLRALTDPRIGAGLPPFDRPTLFSESALVAAPAGAGTASHDGVVPRTIAVEPAHVTGPPLSIGLRQAQPGARAWLWIDGASATVPFELFGADIHLAGSAGLSVTPVGALADGAPDELGHATVTFDLAALGVAPGLQLWAQWLVVDARTPLVLAASDAVRLTTF